jgi:hypothetical protein
MPHFKLRNCLLVFAGLGVLGLLLLFGEEIRDQTTVLTGSGSPAPAAPTVTTFTGTDETHS